MAFINPRSSYEERPKASRLLCVHRHFNPHSSYEERRTSHPFLWYNSRFQSTLLVWGATCETVTLSTSDSISIHTPRMRSDLSIARIIVVFFAFQSTLLVWGATVSILSIDLLDFTIYFSRTYPFSPQTPPFSYLSCKLHFLCDSTSHCFYNHCLDLLSPS